ncbi:amino acid ABC transporter permease [Lachnospira multipara]|uniref:Amino acid ABC transporter membrane protein 1, PAAT family n=1 Tax=Lachnospira multipara TaxID=28051 RepID=A0A1H5TWW0_9FIRM|nr:amino acid ABC transporter permease [Lachnospira multipara]SEF66521.1 amino acid ABC transporter membrane protein 1, PAAT family [Lachnospira multipara]
MDKDVIISYIPHFKEALFLTLKIGWLGILLSLIIGLVGASLLHFKVKFLQKIVGIYIEIFRNTPLLIQLFFIYFALPKVGIQITAEKCGVLGLGLLGGAYMIETFRSGLEAVTTIQTESALSLGFSKAKTFRYIILPQALSMSIPGLVANIIFLLKETSVFSTISLMDLMFTAKDLIGMYAKTTENLFLLVVFYLIMLIPVSIIGAIVERKVRYAGFGD